MARGFHQRFFLVLLQGLPWGFRYRRKKQEEEEAKKDKQQLDWQAAEEAHKTNRMLRLVTQMAAHGEERARRMG